MKCIYSFCTLDICKLGPEVGTCRAAMRRFHFDHTSGQCKKFIYGGCGRNDNNFITKEDCEKKCGDQG